ncbi:MAG: hypothetical protein ACTSO9_04835 [Candidatus Helarchaeota archaeon]
MSDFGVSITITRKDKKDITGRDKLLISEFLNQFAKLNNFKDALGRLIKLDKVTDSEEDLGNKILKGVTVIISEYWASETESAFESEEKLLEFIYQDKDIGDDIVIALKTHFKETFNVELYYGFW